MITQEISFHVKELDAMKKYPKTLFFRGKTELLSRKKISIVGSRKPNQYARHKTQELAQKLSRAGICIVSGGAIGIDAISHKAAGEENTILVAATGLDKRYPAINSTLIEDVQKRGLLLSQFEDGAPSTRYNFVIRNELVVALGDVLIVTYADLDSGTMRSVEFAQKMGKDIYVLSHRIGESEGTNTLLADGKAKAIYDIDAFVASFAVTSTKSEKNDEFLEFCKTNPTYDEALSKFPARVFEAELGGEILVKNGLIELA